MCNNSAAHSSCVTIAKGQWHYGTPESVLPNCTEYSCVKWYSDDSSIASVNETTGYIYGVDIGTTRIYAATCGRCCQIGCITVTVIAPVPVTGISLSAASLTMNVGDIEYVYETIYPANATNKKVTWESSDTSVATVNLYRGVIHAKSTGIATITATTSDGEFTASCEVRVRDIPVTEIEIPATKYMIIGEISGIEAEIKPSNATNKQLLWESTKPNIATIDTNGNAFAFSQGTTNITAKSVADESIYSEKCSLEVLSQEKVERANQIIQENAQFICEAANDFGLPPASVAMVIYAEQCINVDLKDEIIDPLVAPLLDVSLGLGQVRISTAKMIEDSGYMPVTHYTDWHGNNSVENRDYGIALKLMSAQTNVKYVAAYLALIIDLWQEKYPLISSNYEVLATLYNVGENGASGNGPHANPKSNAFGKFSSQRRSYLNQLLG